LKKKILQDRDYLWDIGLCEGEHIEAFEVENEKLFIVTVYRIGTGSAAIKVHSTMTVALLKLYYNYQQTSLNYGHMVVCRNWDIFWNQTLLQVPSLY